MPFIRTVAPDEPPNVRLDRLAIQRRDPDGRGGYLRYAAEEVATGRTLEAIKLPSQRSWPRTTLLANFAEIGQVH